MEIRSRRLEHTFLYISLQIQKFPERSGFRDIKIVTCEEA